MGKLGEFGAKAVPHEGHELDPRWIILSPTVGFHPAGSGKIYLILRYDSRPGIVISGFPAGNLRIGVSVFSLCFYTLWVALSSEYSTQQQLTHALRKR